MVGRMDVVRIAVGSSRGTGFAIAPNLVLTALHVVGRVVDGKLQLHGNEIRIVAAISDSGSSAQLRYPVEVRGSSDIDFDPDNDWATIAVDPEAFRGISVRLLGAVVAEDTVAGWRTYGFPDSHPDLGKATGGEVRSIGALIRLHSTTHTAIQLYSGEAGAAHGGAVHGYSGAPVIGDLDGRVIGFVCSASVDAAGQSTEGTLYALPLIAIESRIRLSLQRDRSRSRLPRATLQGGATPRLVARTPTLGTHTFVGRERELTEIDALLSSETDVQLRAALDGLPGIGKTELARQLVARLMRDKRFPGGIYWFDAEDPDLRLQWAKLVDDAEAPALSDLNTRARWAVRQVEQRALRGKPVLIVLDNVETWAPPPGPLPNVSGIRMLATTRARWLHNSFQPYEVPPLHLGPARALLDAIVGHHVAAADELLLALGGHVLSIEIAATYLREYGTSPADYLRRLATGKNPGSAVADQTSYRATADRAFNLLWKKVPSRVQQGWFRAAQLPPAWFSTELADAILVHADYRRELVRFHLLDRDGEGRHQMHRLIREFALAKWGRGGGVEGQVIEMAAQWLRKGGALAFQRYRRDAESFVHLLAVSKDSPAGSQLRLDCAIALRQLGEQSTARQLLEEALAWHMRGWSFFRNSEATTEIRTALAMTLRDLGEREGARQLLELVLQDSPYDKDHYRNEETVRLLSTVLPVGELLALRRKLERTLASHLKRYGENSWEVAIDRHNLAKVLQDLGELAAARPLYEQALAFNVKRYGEGVSDVVALRTSLGKVLWDLGDLAAARQLCEQGLAWSLKTDGEGHPNVARLRKNLAMVLQGLGDLAGARQLLEQALSSKLKTYGEDNHDEVATVRNSLAIVLHQLGELVSARQLYEQALASAEKTDGEGHPSVATLRKNLATVLQDLGELAVARQLFEQALSSDLKTYGEDHAKVATVRNSLAIVLHQLGELTVARQLYEQALYSDLKRYGEDHAEVATVRNNLAMLLRDLGELAVARQLSEQALASNLKTYGEDHHRVAVDRSTLASVLQDLGELAAARDLLEQALASDLKTYGENHRRVTKVRNSLAAVRKELGELL